MVVLRQLPTEQNSINLIVHHCSISIDIKFGKVSVTSYLLSVMVKSHYFNGCKQVNFLTFGSIFLENLESVVKILGKDVIL